MTTALDTRPTYTEDIRRQALSLYAMENGRREPVTHLLAQAGLDIPYSTLRSWAVDSHKDLYQQIRGEIDQFVRLRMSDQARAAASLAMDTMTETVRQYREGLVEGRVPLSDLPKHARDLATPAGILIDKGELLSGNPTEITRSGVADINVEVESLGIKIVLPEVVVPQEKALGEGAGKDLPVIETRPVEERA